MENQKKWFESWFDTRYYHLLYKNRDDREARLFLDRILQHLSLKPDAKILDLACGKGRHAVYLAEKGFQVTGFDLSPSNIEAAQKHPLSNLSFEIRDMRNPLGNEAFDAVFSLFTGFGYFDTDEENFTVFQRISEALKPKGIFLFDYLNESYVRNLPTEPTHFTIEGIDFITRKEFSGRWVIKHIEVHDGQKVYHFSEKVAMYSEQEITHELSKYNIQKTSLLGDYELGEYTPFSPRCILIGKKESSNC